jgi:hypothetical protein
MIFFQGGPGYPGPRVLGRTGWIRRAVKDYRVLLLDDRGTGRREQICAQSLARRGSAREREEYLTHFRADSIVRDAELIRRELLGPDGKWAALTPLGRTADEVYRATYPVLARKNRLYHERYPEDRERVRQIVRALEAGDIRLPSGERLPRRRFLQLGLQFGFHDGFEQVHDLLDTAFVKGRKGPEIGYPSGATSRRYLPTGRPRSSPCSRRPVTPRDLPRSGQPSASAPSFPSSSGTSPRSSSRAR